MSVKQKRCLRDISEIIQSGLCGLWRDQQLCDAVITTKNDSIKCHKVVLAAHSSILARMISEYSPEDFVRIRLPAYSMKTVLEVVNYLYTNEAGLSVENIPQILSLGQKLGLTAVLEACKSILVKYANVDNAVLHYSIALNNNLPDTSRVLFDFIADNFCAVSQTPQFLYLSLERLHPLVQSKNLNVCCEMDVLRAVVNWVNFDRANRMREAKRLVSAINFEDISIDELIQETERSQWLLSECSPVRDVIFEAIRCQSTGACGRINLPCPYPECPRPCFPLPVRNSTKSEAWENFSCVHNCCSEPQCSCDHPLMPKNNFCCNNMNFSMCRGPKICCRSARSSESSLNSSTYRDNILEGKPQLLSNKNLDHFREINGPSSRRRHKKRTHFADTTRTEKTKRKSTDSRTPRKYAAKRSESSRSKSTSSTGSHKKVRSRKSLMSESRSSTDRTSTLVESIPSSASSRSRGMMTRGKSKRKRRRPTGSKKRSRRSPRSKQSASQESRASSEASSKRRAVKKHPSRDKKSAARHPPLKMRIAHSTPKERIHESYMESKRKKHTTHSNANNALLSDISVRSDDATWTVYGASAERLSQRSRRRGDSSHEIIGIRSHSCTRLLTPNSSRRLSFVEGNMVRNNNREELLSHSSICRLHSSEGDFMLKYNLSSEDAPYILVIGGLDLHRVDSDVPGRLITGLSVSSTQRGLGSWIAVPMQLEQFLHHHQVALLHGRLYLVGGAIFNPKNPNRLGTATDGVTIFDFRSGQWRLGSPMISPRAYFGMARWHDRLIVVGGESDDSSETDEIDYYDTTSDTWGFLTRHPGGPRLGVAVAALKNVLYVVGGYSEYRSSRGEIMADTHSYNLMTGQWCVLSQLDRPTSHATLVVLNNSTLVLAGGRTVINGQKGSSTNAVMAYFETRDVWRKVGQLSVGRHDMASAVVKTNNSCGCAYLIGGMSNPHPAALRLVECLTFDEEDECATVLKVSNCPYAVTGAACCLVK